MQSNNQPGAGAVTPAPVNNNGNCQATVVAPNGITARGFRKAVKFGAKARVAFIGVAGSGKSYTMLTLARALAGPEGKIAAIDTEHGSLSKYADSFMFDVDEPDSYTTEYLLEQLDFAEQNGYSVFCVDSLSHFWMGKDGALEFVDNAKKRTRDQMEGWKMFRPHERKMVDRFIASPCHVLVTMRTKTDYEDQIVDGRKKRVKIGLAPVQRDGLEYEFDLVCSMDEENNLAIDKTRCSTYSAERMRLAAKPNEKYFQPFIDWLAGPAAAIQPVPKPITTAPLPPPVMTPAQAIAAEKIASGDPSTTRPWTNLREAKKILTHLGDIVGPRALAEELERHNGWKSVDDIRATQSDQAHAIEMYHHLEHLARGVMNSQTEVA